MTIGAWIQGVALSALAAGVVLMLSPGRLQGSLRWCAAVCVLAALWTPLAGFLRSAPAPELPEEIPGLPEASYSGAGADWMVSRIGRGMPGLGEASFFCEPDEAGRPVLIRVVLSGEPAGQQEEAANALAGAVRGLYHLERTPRMVFEVAAG